jgi:lysozyme family protein
MTAENFPACLAFTLKYEGGRSNDPRDPGGRTMEGVTQATYDASRAKKSLGRRDVYMMGAAERNEIYRNEYWDLINGDMLRAGEDLCVFDFAVNSGVDRARRISAVWRKSAVVDAIGGICAHRLSFLHALRTWRYFGAGWGRRVAACEALAIRMAHGKAAPEVLTRKAEEARSKAGKKSTQATVGGAIAGSAAIAHLGMSGTTNAILIFIVVLAGIYFFYSWRQGQRADALSAAVADLKVQREALDQKTKAAAMQADLAAKEAANRQQEVALAQKAISELSAKPTDVTNTTVERITLQKPVPK